MAGRGGHRGRGVVERGGGDGAGGFGFALLSNVYLHYVFDLWADQWRRRNARGDVILARFADDLLAGFERREDAERFLAGSAREVRGVRVGAASGQDAADRVRAVRHLNPASFTPGRTRASTPEPKGGAQCVDAHAGIRAGGRQQWLVPTAIAAGSPSNTPGVTGRAGGVSHAQPLAGSQHLFLREP